ncbi:hypothetical protein FIBSPDRAFT_963328 [Athelia psychrophila]|uniref:Uncharacterized protein n=1 Tax=Athelia psychrophila TaxID=1759441 RepID=A0A165Z1U6_9AGAM|nr:hypothetical protein FIBSPDRAFT_963328 [Fibularhizoctonia sp. CBS 109695]
MDIELRSWARWEVDRAACLVRSSTCERQTTNTGGICSKCLEIAQDKTLKGVIHKANQESQKPIDEQAKIHAGCQKHAPNTLAKYEGRSLRAHLEDLALFKAFKHLEADETATAFLELY